MYGYKQQSQGVYPLHLAAFHGWYKVALGPRLALYSHMGMGTLESSPRPYVLCFKRTFLGAISESCSPSKWMWTRCSIQRYLSTEPNASGQLFRGRLNAANSWIKSDNISAIQDENLPARKTRSRQPKVFLRRWRHCLCLHSLRICRYAWSKLVFNWISTFTTIASIAQGNYELWCRHRNRMRCRITIVCLLSVLTENWERSYWLNS